MGFKSMTSNSHDKRINPTAEHGAEANGGEFAMIVLPACTGEYYAAAFGISVSFDRPVGRTDATVMHGGRR